MTKRTRLLFMAAAGLAAIAPLTFGRTAASQSTDAPELSWSGFGAGGGTSQSLPGGFRLDSTVGQLGGSHSLADGRARPGFWFGVRCFEDFDGLDEDLEERLGGNLCAFDTDNDTIADGGDACVLKVGRLEWRGCPAGDQTIVMLRVKDKAKSHACPHGARRCEFPLEGVAVKVFDRNKLKGLEIKLLGDDDGEGEDGHPEVDEDGDNDRVTLTKNPRARFFDDIFESMEANGDRVSGALAAPFGCTTGVDGSCVAGEEAIGDYLIIAKYVDTNTGRVVYVGKSKGPKDFVDTDGDGVRDRATKKLTITKVIKKDGEVEFRAAGRRW
jgi:hypothetical protein